MKFFKKRTKELTIPQLSPFMTKNVEFILDKEVLELKKAKISLNSAIKELESRKGSRKTSTPKKSYLSQIKSFHKKITLPKEFTHSKLNKFTEERLNSLKEFSSNSSKDSIKLKTEFKSEIRTIERNLSWLNYTIKIIKVEITNRKLKTIEDIHSRIKNINNFNLSRNDKIKRLQKEKSKLIDKEAEFSKRIDKLRKVNNPTVFKELNNIIKQLDQITKELIKVSEQEDTIEKNYFKKEIRKLESDLKKLGYDIRIKNAAMD